MTRRATSAVVVTIAARAWTASMPRSVAYEILTSPSFGRHLADLRPQDDSLAECSGKALGELGGPTAQAAPENDVSAAPDVRKERRHAAGGHLLRLGRQPIRRRAEDRVRIRVERADEVGERAVVEEREDARTDVRRCLTRALTGQGVVLLRRAAHLQARPDEGKAAREGHRKPQRIRLRAAASDHLATVGHAEEAAREGKRLEPHLLDQAGDDRAPAREHVGADAEPVVPAWLGLHAAADALLGLEHQHVPVAQRPGGG